MTALQNLKIADFSWVGAGPRATKDLADNGATVIKIESRKRLDLGRRSPPFVGDHKDPDGSAFFAQTNTSKLSVTINLMTDEGIELAKRLIAWADVVVENFGPGFMERIGLGYEELKNIKPDIILASVSVAGKTGPMSGFRGYGNSAAAHSGHADMTGWPGTEPHMPPLAYGDVIAPMFATVAILAALEERQRTGLGQHLDVSQIEPMVHVIADLLAQPEPVEKLGNADPDMAPHGVYATQNDDEWIAVAVETDEQWLSFCDALNEPGLDDYRDLNSGQRLQQAAKLDQLLVELCRGRDRDELIAVLEKAAVPVAQVLDGETLFKNDELNRFGHFVELDHPVLGRSKMPAPPMIFSATPCELTRSPCLGEHNHQVFVELLGLPPADYNALVEAEIIL